MNTRVATYHARPKDSNLESLAKGVRESDRSHILKLIYTEHGDQSTELINMLFASARLMYPNCSCDVLTDEVTNFKNLSKLGKVRRYPSNPKKLMQNRLDAQIAYLKELKGEETVLLVDSDILVNRRLDIANRSSEYFLILTARDNEEMPINGGVFIISGQRRDEAIKFLERVAQIHKLKYDHLGTWGGNQLALKDAVEEWTGRKVSARESLDNDLMVLPASLYNYTPPQDNLYQSIRKPRKEFLIHFKGMRKRAMRLYFEAIMKRSRCASFKIHLLYIAEMAKGKLRGLRYRYHKASGKH